MKNFCKIAFAAAACAGVFQVALAGDGKSIQPREWVLNHGPAAGQAKVTGGLQAVRGGVFRMLSTSGDVTLTLPMAKEDAFKADYLPIFALRYRTKSPQKIGGIFYTTDTLTKLCDRSFTSFPVTGDGTWRNVVMDMRQAQTRNEWKGTVTSFRIDPINPSEAGTVIEISRVGFFPNVAAAGRFLDAANDEPDEDSSKNEAPIYAWDRGRFQIGAYCLNPPTVRTREVIRDIKKCGIDFIVGVPDSDKAALECFKLEGVGVVVGGAVPGWWGGDGDRAGQLKKINPIGTYKWCMENFIRKAAATAVDIGDEPSALDFPYYGEVVKALNAWRPEVPLYLNLYPNYASVAENNGKQTVNQLGTPTYREHIAEYCKHVPLPYISYDFYPYMKNAAANDAFRLKMYDNFKIVADACRATNRDFWYIPQVNSRYDDLHMTENTLRFQAYASMAFGAVSITWACYTPGWWKNNVIQPDGTKNVEYARLQKVNAEIRKLATPFMHYRSTATHFVDFPTTEKLDTIGVKVLDAAECGPFKGVELADHAPLLVGEMAARNGKGSAIFVMAADDMYDQHPAVHNLHFRAKGKVRAFGGSGEVKFVTDPAGVSHVRLASNQALLITAEK